MKPHLVQALTGKSGTRTLDARGAGASLSAGDARAIQDAMQAAVECDVGRQFTSGARRSGMPTAGKSGTPSSAGRRAALVVHRLRAGRDPRIAIAVLVERGGRGGERAAPIAGEMMTAYFDPRAAPVTDPRPPSEPARSGATREPAPRGR